LFLLLSLDKYQFRFKIHFIAKKVFHTF